MRPIHQFLPALAVTALACGFSSAAQAQVGSGWKSTTPSFVLHQFGSGKVQGNNFTISNSSTSTQERAERRYATIASGKQRQFEGTLRVNSMGGDRISLKQCFGKGPYSLLAIKKPGTLYQVQGGDTLASLPIGATARINTIINTRTNTAEIYVNGSKRNTVHGQGPWYDKVGAYRTASGRGPVNVTWTNIRFWEK
jgi:hypothetical protein